MFTRIAVLAALLGAPVGAAEIKIIVNLDAGIQSLAGSELEDIYLGKRHAWGNGHHVVVFSHADRHESERFLDIYLDKTPGEFAGAWKRLVFTGTGTPPTELPDDAEMIAKVRATAGAIGYINGTQADPAGVAVITIAK